jgi:3-isopropylmalate/(R)-2-methylmalate dehydratase large subunit
MTVCNMSIEGGARAGMVAPDDTTFAYLEGRPHAPKGKAGRGARLLALAAERRRRLVRQGVHLDAATLKPHVTWGTNPGQVVPIDGSSPTRTPSPTRPSARRPRARSPTWASAGTAIRDDRGRHRLHRLVHELASRTCARRRRARRPATSEPACGRSWCRARTGSRRRPRTRASTGVPAAGFEWREPGCSMCLAMNPDKLSPGERCASTSNRNFEGRQGRGGRTHLVSPAVAAATAVAAGSPPPRGAGPMKPSSAS